MEQRFDSILSQLEKLGEAAGDEGIPALHRAELLVNVLKTFTAVAELKQTALAAVRELRLLQGG